MTTFTFAGDEAGDVSFSFTKGASRYFVAAVIATQAPDDLRAVLAAVRRAAHLPEDFDFHFNRRCGMQSLAPGPSWWTKLRCRTRFVC